MNAPARVSAGVAARDILRRLHEVMASRSSAQAKLNRVVNIIARSLSSEVCSIYLLRDGVLELFATHGLKQSSVHVTRMAIGEGLVGHIAANKEPLNLAEAAAHPDFAYKPETGEELYHSFAGVPIIRQEISVGVVCVQHVDPRDYDDIEIEALQTVAMVLSELISAAGLIDERSISGVRAHEGPLRLEGLPLVDGIGRGRAVHHQPRIVVEQTVAEDVDAEKQRVSHAFQVMRGQIDDMLGKAEFAAPGDHDDILETYKMFAYDEGWIRRITEAIENGLTAEAAIERVQMKTRRRLREAKDPFFAERLHDLDDLSNRLLRIVSGQLGTAAELGLRRDTILLARNLGPAELLEYDRRYLKGVVLEEGSATAHVIIIARAMGVPVLGQVKDIRAQIADGDPLVLDAGRGLVFVRPQDAVVQQFTEQIAARARRQAEYAKLVDKPARTVCGTDVSLQINAGLRSDLPQLDTSGADGIGLFRTEFQFLVSATLPRRERQTRLYQSVLEAAGDRPVTFRTVDIGGDKAVPYVSQAGREENPAMGYRALRLALGREGLMKVQARALLDAAAGRTLNVMFPMVSEPWEFDAARALVEEQRRMLGERGRPVPDHVRYGAMFEVPALAEVLPELLERVDFLSVGTNDLFQFLFAADRSHPLLAERYDWLSISALRFLKRIVDAADRAGKPVTVCGEMGGRPLAAMALFALGYRRVSITPAGVGPVKAMVRSLDLQALKPEFDGWLSAGRNMRAALEGWAEMHGVALPLR
ncbi:phosphoenolpyruvate--protein phosphotransferase [Pacificimonas flava]|uniref:phosphoenolpyruvate--protein phosphotransferase n=2 Tax=Pacificimonas TaxID=1960290 RepID=A0A219B2L8_9SPHN|nr:MULTISPECIES: phosphoenolpyruvate--protein phosphotransferase [Pacificimonas]MBZ6377760.1 phosphoenolpyruvate--protein phosphotransferase [Pacificimonas aurantium]OWV32565.1 phosphoenolpyruvate--protein phosphotransferase [Pacificimonas flava]